MTVIRISEQARVSESSFIVRVTFGDHAEYDIRVSDPAAIGTEKLLAWYFEKHLQFPFLDADLEEEAVQQLTAYGVGLFRQVFSGEANHDYRTLRDHAFDGCRIEVAGSTEFHILHWELLRDPDMDTPLAVRFPMTRRVTRLGSKFALPPEQTTLNVLVVTARPFGISDVGYRTISRPLLGTMRQSLLPVVVDLVRPGTWEALSAHLQEHTRQHGSGWYQIIHFDVHGIFSSYAGLRQDIAMAKLAFGNIRISPFEGRRPFLFFESAEDSKAIPVPAAAVASLLEEHRIPVAIMNACQSAMQDGNEASLAQSLVAAGVPAAVGMAYSVTVSAAALAMPVLYRQITQRGDVVGAIQGARRALYEMTSRQAYFGQAIDLQDWALPVTFWQREITIRLRPMADEDQTRFYQRQAAVGDEPPSEYGFVGRDLDILAIERRLLATGNRNGILVHGLAGAGKSTLLRHLAWWWKRTGLIDEAFVYSYEDRAWTCGQIVSDLQSTLLTAIERSRAEIMPETAQLEQVAHLLRARRHLLVLDNAESITASSGAVPHSLDSGERAKIRTLLGRLRGGQTLVIVGSRETEAWLAKESFGTNRYALPGLDSQAASELAELVLRRHGATHWLHDPNERAALQDLLILLGGSPLSMTVVLPVLADDAPSEVLSELRAGETDTDPDGKIGRAVEYSHGKLSPVLQMSLLMLAPFESVIPIEVLGHYQERLLQEEPVQAAGEIDLERAVAEAVRVGLATPHPGPGHMVQVQPVLPYFLRNRLQDQTDLRDAAERAHYTIHCDLGQDVMNALGNGSDPLHSINAMTFMKASYSNFSTALAYGLRTGRPIIHLISVLAGYLRSTHQYDSCQKLLEETIEAYPEPAGPAQKLDLAIAHTLSGDLAVAEHRLEDAKRHYGLMVELLRPFDHPMVEASAYSQLGVVASEERQYAVAESYYRQALEIKLANGSRADAASTYHQLGIMCQAQQRLTEADNFFKEALAIYQEVGIQRESGDVLNQLAQVAAAREKPSEAEEYYRRALSIYLDFDDQADAAKIYVNLGALAEEQGRIAEADAFYRRALNIQLLMGAKNNAAHTYHNLGTLARAQERHEEARSCYNRALEIYSDFRDQPSVAFTLLSLGKLAQSEGQCQEAKENYQQALKIYQDYNDRSHIANILHLLGQVAVMQAAYHEAEKQYGDALEIYREIDAQFKVGMLHQDLGSLLSLIPERQEEAERHHRDALSIQRETSNGHIMPETHQSAGIIAFRQERYADAEQMFNAALSSYAKSGNRRGEAAAYQNLGMMAQHRYLYSEAEEIYRKCLEICKDCGYREIGSVVGTQLGVVLAKLGRHAEATNMLIGAAVTYRTDKGEWEKDDMQWLRCERSALGSADFSQAIETLVPADLRDEINAAIEAAEPPEEG